MPPTFDPVRKRKFWLDFNLAYETRLEPDEIPVKGQAIYLSTMTNSLINAYLLGLVDRVQPTLEAIVSWMENRQPPPVQLFSEPWEHWRDGWYAQYVWHRTLGLCKWLCGRDGAERDFRRALDVEWLGWRQAQAYQADRDFRLRWDALSEHLALALAANEPMIGLHFRTAAGIRQVSADHPPLLFMGQWACLNLEGGRARDAGFVNDAAEMLSDTLWPELLSAGRHTEAALWLKAFYWDTGVDRTPEEVMARAYDFLPGGKRPDFVPAKKPTVSP